MLIAAISDTHIPDKALGLPEALVEQLREVDLILHAGDFTSADVLTFIQGIGQVIAVHGNVDDDFLRYGLPRQRIIEVNGFRIGLTHGYGSGGTTLERAYRAFQFQKVDAIVFGHSHMPVVESHDSVLMINPGSPTDKRRAPRPSFALLRVTDTIEAEIVYL